MDFSPIKNKSRSQGDVQMVMNVLTLVGNDNNSNILSKIAYGLGTSDGITSQRLRTVTLATIAYNYLFWQVKKLYTHSFYMYFSVSKQLFTEKFVLNFTFFKIHLLKFNNNICKAFYHYSCFSVVFPYFMRFIWFLFLFSKFLFIADKRLFFIDVKLFIFTFQAFYC